MAAPLATPTKEKQRSLIRFSSSEWVKSIEIHRRMKVQYGDVCLSLQQGYGWTRKFINGITSTMVTGHGKLRSYLHRFGITDNPMCPCEEEEQTADHLIFQRKKLRNQRY